MFHSRLGLPNIPSTHAPTLPPPFVCIGLTSVAQGQGESQVLDWLEDVEEGSSEWLNGFFTFLYGMINPPEEEEEEPRGALGGVLGAQEDDEEEEDEAGANVKGTKDDATRGQKIVIVGLHNQ